MAPHLSSAKHSGPQPLLEAANNCNELWWRDPGLRTLNFWLAVLFLSPFMIGFDGSLIGGLLAIPQWLKAQSLGGLIGFLPTSYLMDKFGRRRSLFWEISWSLVQLQGKRFVDHGHHTLEHDLSSPGTVGSLFGSFFFLGAIVSAWTTFGTLHILSSWSWRIPTLMQILPAVIQASLIVFVAESPRWLVKMGRNAEAKNFFVTYHANGIEDGELALLENTEVCQMIHGEASEQTAGWLDYIRTGPNRKRLFITLMVALFAQCSGNGIVSYYFVLVLQSAGINGGLQIFNWLMVILASLFVDKVGRRKLFLGSSVAMLVTLIAVAICNERFLATGNISAGYCMIPFPFPFNGAYDFAYSPLPTLYTAEIHPFDLLAKGVSISFASAFGLGLFNQYVNQIALEAITWKYYLVFIAIVACQLPIIYFIFPKTKGLTVVEVRYLFEGGSTDSVLQDLRSKDRKQSMESLHVAENA
ncbi:hypothetical protein FOVSG1_002108 [Fusarium oxysporum f. sp. vasinfectum]